MRRLILLLTVAGIAGLLAIAITTQNLAQESGFLSLRVPAPEFPAIAGELSNDTGGGSHDGKTPTTQGGTQTPSRVGDAPTVPSLGGSQPDFPGEADEGGITWINSKPLSMHGLRGKVVMIDFWDYTCINCIRTFPFNKKIWSRYKADGFVLIGVDDAEFSSATPVERAREAVKRLELPYPIVSDYHYQIWNAYNNQYWPNVFLIDANGDIRFNHPGEGGEDDIERAIQQLLKEAHPGLTFPASYTISADVDSSAPNCGGTPTPEMYVGKWGDRGILASPEGYHEHKIVDYAPQKSVDDGRVVLTGRWETERDGMVYRGKHKPDEVGPDRLTMRYHARELYSVINVVRDRAIKLYIKQDGEYLTAANKGADVKIDAQGRSYLEIHDPRMYYLVQNPEFGSHQVDLYPGADGVMINSFTFGNSCQTKFDHL
jgi:peroxiredoxin